MPVRQLNSLRKLVEFLVHLALDFRMQNEHEDAPLRGRHGGLAARKEQVQQEHLQLLVAEFVPVRMVYRLI